MHKTVIAFDFDGTIIDISRRDYAVYRDLVQDLSGSILPFEIYWPLRRKRTDINLILAKSGVTDTERINIFLQQRASLIEDVKYLVLDTVLPRVVNTLKLNSSWITPYLVTTRYNENNLRWQLEGLGLNIVFEDIIIAEKDKTKFYSGVNNLSLIVGDTEKDIDAANTLGIKSVAVLSGIRDADIIRLSHPTFIEESVASIDFPSIMHQ